MPPIAKKKASKRPAQPRAVKVPKDAQAAYALAHYGIADLPADWNPSTHYADGRPMTPTFPPVDRSAYETKDGAWIIPPAQQCFTRQND